MTSLAQQPTILVFGDSLSAGYGLERHHAWPRLMQQRLQSNNLPYRVINHSISGETTSGGVSRFNASLDEVRPVIVILELGANDGLRGQSPKAMKTNLQRMIDMAHERKIKVILVGMRIPINYGKAYTDLFYQQFVNLAKNNNTAFVPFLMQGLSKGLEMYQPDGLHPTAAAQPQMMHNVWQALQPLL
jgi:acyl-CoA thioesterase-1